MEPTDVVLLDTPQTRLLKRPHACPGFASYTRETYSMGLLVGVDITVHADVPAIDALMVERYSEPRYDA